MASKPEIIKRVTRSCTRVNASDAQAPIESSKGKSKTATSGSKASRTSKVAAKSSAESDAIKGTIKSKDWSAPTNVSTFSITSALVKNPIQSHKYIPSTPSQPTASLIFTHGAGGTLSAPAVVNFCTGFSTTLPVLAFQGSMNLASRVKGFRACIQEKRGEGNGERLVLGGRSMGARAAVMAATEDDEKVVELVLVSYPLKGPKDDIRDQILKDLPASIRVLFVIGDRDAMCPLDMLDEVRKKMKAKSQLVVVRGADHGMHVKPASMEKEYGEETGRIAAEWISGNVKEEVVYIGEEG
jgi:predicted alpha/beta-hydrolase family hydrolase